MMNRREMLLRLSMLPLAVETLKRDEALVTMREDPTFPKNTLINACCSCLLPSYFRMALDMWGEDCQAYGNIAQRSAWNLMRMNTGNEAYDAEFNKEIREFFSGKEFSVDGTLPLDVIEFRKQGKTIGKIINLAIPYPYGELDAR